MPLILVDLKNHLAEEKKLTYLYPKVLTSKNVLHHHNSLEVNMIVNTVSLEN
jgi:hypothetical protein